MNAKETSHRQFMIGCDTQYLKESLGSSSVLFIFFFFQALTYIMKIPRLKYIVLKLLAINIQIRILTYIGQSISVRNQTLNDVRFLLSKS